MSRVLRGVTMGKEQVGCVRRPPVNIPRLWFFHPCFCPLKGVDERANQWFALWIFSLSLSFGRARVQTIGKPEQPLELRGRMEDLS
jgi:hypothetical protein